jgi:hypothetical protein
MVVFLAVKEVDQQTIAKHELQTKHAGFHRHSEAEPFHIFEWNL